MVDEQDQWEKLTNKPSESINLIGFRCTRESHELASNFFFFLSFHINIFLLKSLQFLTGQANERHRKQKMAWIYGEMTMNSVYTHLSTTAIYTNPRDRYFLQFILEFGFIYVHRSTDSICEKFQPYFDVVVVVIFTRRAKRPRAD